MGRHTPEQRRKNMQAVKNKDSEIELLLRKELWSRGLRYHKNSSNVFGKAKMESVLHLKQIWAFGMIECLL